jgi:hypothetical protein
LVNFFLFLPLSLTLLTLTSRNIEKAFLQNDAAILAALCQPDSAIQVSLPEPIGFSDVLSPGQVRVFFEQLFARFPTFEFFIESPLPLFLPGDRWFIRARWSFLEKKSLQQYVFRIYFQVKMMEGFPNRGVEWRIIEIRAEKI